MSFSSGAPHPITAGGAAAEYTHKFKKHFGDRPTAFALSSHPFSSTSGLASSSSHNPSTVLDPFAASTSYHSRAAAHPAPAYHTQSSGAAQAGLTSPASASASVGVGPGFVDSETHSQLANLGWRIRSRVNQGYTRSVTSHQDPFNTGFKTEREILSNVTNTRRGWSRTATAPTIAADFDGLRHNPPALNGCEKRMDTPACAPKRARSTSDTDSDDEEQRQEEKGGRRTANMPKLSFSSSTSSTTSSVFSAPGRGLNRAPSSTNAFPSTVIVDEDDKAMAMDTDEETKPIAYDFSAHFNCTDF